MAAPAPTVMPCREGPGAGVRSSARKETPASANGRQRLAHTVYLNRIGNSHVVPKTNSRELVVSASEPGYSVKIVLAHRSLCSTLPTMENLLLINPSRL